MCKTDSEFIKVCSAMPDLSAEAIKLAIEENPDNALPELDAVLESVMEENLDDIIPALSAKRSVQDSESLKLALTIHKKWEPGRILRVRFLDGDPVVHKKIEYYARQWEQYANIKFDFGSDPNAEIRISCRLGEGSWSALGTDALSDRYKDPSSPKYKGEATMNYGWLTPNSPNEVYSDVVLHEFGHALGCIHEHQHPEAGIPWNREAVYSYYMGPPNNWSKGDVDHNIFRTLDKSETQFSQFDPKSIMIYSIPNELTIGDFEVGRNTQLSETDKQFIRRAYPFPQSSTETFEIQAKHSGKVLDVADEKTEGGANIIQWSKTGSDNQKWKLEDAGNGYYYIVAKHSGKVLDVADEKTEDGANIIQWSKTGGDNQRWIFTSSSSSSSSSAD